MAGKCQVWAPAGIRVYARPVKETRAGRPWTKVLVLTPPDEDGTIRVRFPNGDEVDVVRAKWTKLLRKPGEYPKRKKPTPPTT